MGIIIIITSKIWCMLMPIAFRKHPKWTSSWLCSIQWARRIDWRTNARKWECPLCAGKRGLANEMVLIRKKSRAHARTRAYRHVHTHALHPPTHTHAHEHAHTPARTHALKNNSYIWKVWNGVSTNTNCSVVWRFTIEAPPAQHPRPHTVWMKIPNR